MHVALDETASRAPTVGDAVGLRISVRNVALAVLGALVLVLKPAYHGPLYTFVYSYAGNFSVSFALYFAALSAMAKCRWPRLTAASATLVAVEAFELTDGFGLLVNVFDAGDLLANAAGIGFAVLVDVLTWHRPVEA